MKQGRILPYKFKKKHGLSDTLLLDFRPGTVGQEISVVSRDQRWYFVKAVLGN